MGASVHTTSLIVIQCGFVEDNGVVSELRSWLRVVDREHRVVRSGLRIISGKRRWNRTWMSVMGSGQWAYIVDMAIHTSRSPRGGQDTEIRAWAERKKRGRK